MTGDEERKKGAYTDSGGIKKGREKDKEKERGQEVMLAVGSKTQKNSVACHGTESTPKIHSLAPLSHVRKVARTLRNALLDTRDDV